MKIADCSIAFDLNRIWAEVVVGSTTIGINLYRNRFIRERIRWLKFRIDSFHFLRNLQELTILLVNCGSSQKLNSLGK
ncbi:hypothetical protein LEP1GSC036_4807 [Leptospira weilii str. 2006001853]|uniref:Uncharacterized protein n=1 Tax=Leptospira weilii str. 2006001853 TaxID=1001589 RepID=A0A828Z209_9LEPT|nr:hypothetical protein LEP1GSC036_4807 [Leptospira weilii str. 2006001853]EMN45629.1 hypothetical protein LEP1GSC086_2521 [Leptospira weilii str. LNT 1234]